MIGAKLSLFWTDKIHINALLILAE